MPDNPQNPQGNPDTGLGATPPDDDQNAGGNRGARVLSSRLANKTELVLTTIFLLALTLLLLAGIMLRWPRCSQPEAAANNANAPANTNTAASPPAGGNTNRNANTGANTNAGTNTNTNTNTGTNTGATTNTNTNTATNTAGNTNGNTSTPTPPPPGQQERQASNQNTAATKITSVEPGSGSISGNTRVTIKGSGFKEGDVVLFDQSAATTVGTPSDTSITVKTPAHEQGGVDVALRRDEKDIRTTLSDGYKYVCPAPEGTSLFLILVMAGALGGCIHALRSLYWYAGNEELRVPWLLMYFILPFTGAAMAMIFGLLIIAGFINNTTSQSASYFIIAVGGLVGMFTQQAALKLTDIANATFTKPGPGKDSRQQESQSVGAGAGAATTTAHITPNSGPPDTKVVITGTGFTDAKSVTFGGVAAKDAAFDKATSNITATAPARAPGAAPGTVDVVVTNGAGKTVTLSYTYTAAAVTGGQAAAAPTVTALSIQTGSSNGGDTVEITGTNFAAPVTVNFGDAAATVVTVTPKLITVKTPAHAAGPVKVSVSSGGQTATATNPFVYT